MKNLIYVLVVVVAASAGLVAGLHSADCPFMRKLCPVLLFGKKAKCSCCTDCDCDKDCTKNGSKLCNKKTGKDTCCNDKKSCGNCDCCNDCDCTKDNKN